MAYALETAKSKFLFTLPSALPIALAAANIAGLPKEHIFLLEGQVDGFTTVQELIELGKQLKPVPAYVIPRGMTNAQMCGYLNFSSGTTGHPKAIQLSHHNIIAQCHQLRQLQVVEPGEQYRILAVTPLFHITGLVRYVHYPVFMNGRSIMMNAFDLEKMLRAIISYRIPELILVPPIIIRVVRDPIVAKYKDALDLTIKRWSSGSAPISAEILEQLRALFPKSGFRQGYGATESTACITAHPPSAYDFKYASSAGKLCANTVAKIVDLDDPTKELGPNQLGELWAKGPQMSSMGYLDNPRATAETFDADGFFHTGDVGRFDDEGFLYIEDRIKEMIKVRGQQVAPAELEDALLGHDAVEDCAVLGIPDDYSGEKPKAYVVLKPGRTPSEDLGKQLLEWVQARKSRFKWLREVEFADSVPKSPTGKLLRRILKANDKASRVRGLRVRDDPAPRAKL
jgi:acyl-CoA synthetase (AMP-forming)/AMP-acid ligase II